MCGVIGIFSTKNVSNKLYFGLNSLQHRGQESCGMTVSDGQTLTRISGMGLAIDVFNQKDIPNIIGNLGIGHVRYSTAGGSHDFNTQPIMGYSKGEQIALAHNGNLINYQILRTRLEEEGMMFQTTIDSEVILYLISRYYKGDIVEAVMKAMERIEGAYSLVVMLKDKLIAVRDPNGFRPLVLGKTETGTIFASENGSIEILGGKVERNLQPGEIVVVDESGETSYFMEKAKRTSHCIFEQVYFARNDATLDGINAYSFRHKAGEILFKESPAEVDLVVPVPDSGFPSAIGYANASGIPIAEGLVKNRYMGRTFIKPTQEEREIAVKLKLNPLRHIVEGKRIILVDDSIVRGTTSKSLIKNLKDAGAKEIHLRITSPPVKYPCYFGIDTPSRKNLIASQNKIEEMAEILGADTLAFLSLEGLIESAGIPKESLCLACFNGKYPIDPCIV